MLLFELLIGNLLLLGVECEHLRIYLSHLSSVNLLMGLNVYLWPPSCLCFFSGIARVRE